jgi:hypothetical protein
MPSEQLINLFEIRLSIISGGEGWSIHSHSWLSDQSSKRVAWEILVTPIDNNNRLNNL